MSSTQSRRGGAAAFRLLALLALVLGLLAMHGLATTHHATTAAAPGHSGPVAGAPHVPQKNAVEHGHENAGPALASAHVARAGTGLPGCDDCSKDLWVLCAAVLVVAAGAAAAVTSAGRRNRRLVPARNDARARTPAALRWSLPTPDPVAELCVSRT